MNKPSQGDLFEGVEFEDEDDVSLAGWDVCSLSCAKALWDEMHRAMGKSRAERRLLMLDVQWHVRPDGCCRLIFVATPAVRKTILADDESIQFLGYPNRPPGIACSMCKTVMPSEPGCQVDGLPCWEITKLQ